LSNAFIHFLLSDISGRLPASAGLPADRNVPIPPNPCRLREQPVLRLLPYPAYAADSSIIPPPRLQINAGAGKTYPPPVPYIHASRKQPQKPAPPRSPHQDILRAPKENGAAAYPGYDWT